MLARLDIRDFTLVDQLTVEFPAGFSPITGETGAGKSILLGALGLVLGDRANTDLVRSGASGTDVSAEFDVSGIAEAGDWLAERELVDADEPGVCLLRRTVSSEGRSRAFVNGRPVTLGDLRAVAEHLVDIHSQHAYTALLRRETQLRLLDEAGGHRDQLDAVRAAHGELRALEGERDSLAARSAEAADRRELLGYQLSELEQLALREGEYAELEAEQKRLAGAEERLRALGGAHGALSEDEDALTGRLGALANTVAELASDDPQLESAASLLESARVHAEEAADELRRQAEGLAPDPARLAEVEARIGALLDAARKHRLRPEELIAHAAALAEEHAAIDADDARLAELDSQVEAARTTLTKAASALTTARSKAAKALEKAVTKELKALGLADARIVMHLEPHGDGQVSATGAEAVEFRFRANAGAEPGPLARIASGGELSRISLAIQVVTARTSRTPTLVLDEADVGIGGGTAEVVGRLLRRLGDAGQVIAVTHLPQVAALGHQHFVVRKHTGKRARSEIGLLGSEERADELARMLGGVEITEQTLAHAREMLARSITG